MTRTEKRLLAAAGALALLIMASYGIRRLIESTVATVQAVSDGTGLSLDGFPWGPVFVVGSLLLLRFAFKLGAYHRGYMHARGIRKSHFNAIRGGRH